MDDAFEALLAGRLVLAEKLARRAVAGSEMNARLWLDLGRVLRRCARLAPIADEWHRLLARRARFPATIVAFVARCADAGQHRPGPSLWRFPPNGFRAAVAEHGQRVAFPFRIWLPLGDGDTTVRMLDVRSRRRRREHAFDAAPGDAVVHAAAERLVDIAGVAAAQSVLVGTAPAEATRLALDVPFHDVG